MSTSTDVVGDATIQLVRPEDPCKALVAQDAFTVVCRRHPVHQSGLRRAEGCTVVPAVLCVACRRAVKPLRAWVTTGVAEPCPRCRRVVDALTLIARTLPTRRHRAGDEAGGPDDEDAAPVRSRRLAPLFAEVVRRGAAPVALDVAAVAPVFGTRGEVLTFHEDLAYVTLEDWDRLVGHDHGAYCASLRAGILANHASARVPLRPRSEEWFERFVAELFASDDAQQPGPEVRQAREARVFRAARAAGEAVR